MYVMKNSKQVELSDRVRFRCTRCGDCCRHVEGVVVVESLDAYKLAKHLGITISDFFTDYTEPYYLEDTQYPIFMLKTTGKDKSCIFLKGNRCTVQDVKPRTCRMYPFWIGPGETVEEFTYNGVVYSPSTVVGGGKGRAQDGYAEITLVTAIEEIETTDNTMIFMYNGGIQTYTVTETGIYKLEV